MTNFTNDTEFTEWKIDPLFVAIQPCYLGFYPKEFPTDQEDTEKAQCEHGKSNDVRNEISQGAGVFPSVGL